MTTESELLLTSTSNREELDMKHSDTPDWIFLISFFLIYTTMNLPYTNLNFSELQRCTLKRRGAVGRHIFLLAEHVPQTIMSYHNTHLKFYIKLYHGALLKTPH